MGSANLWPTPPERKMPKSSTDPTSVNPWDDSPSEQISKSADERTIEVPLTEWRRVLKQVNELMKLSKKLTNARERAAKAETEVSLLQKQIAELRVQRESGNDT
jgi:hypothetical protein